MADDDSQDTVPDVSLGPELSGRGEGERYPVLVALNGPLKDRTFVLNKGEIAIGRNMTADIVVRGAHTSRSHARVAYANIHDKNALPQCRIYDAGSTAGTFVNDRLVGPEGVLLPTRTKSGSPKRFSPSSSGKPRATISPVKSGRWPAATT